MARISIHCSEFLLNFNVPYFLQTSFELYYYWPAYTLSRGTRL